MEFKPVIPQRRAGFSLVELLVVVAIIAILVGAALPFYQDYVQDSKIAKAQGDIDVIRQAIALFEVNEGRPYYPISTSDAGGTLYGIHSGGGDLRGLKGAYLSDLPFDPWGREYKYDRFDKLVFSEGPIVNRYDPAQPADLVTRSDDINGYVINELTVRRIDWVDSNNSGIVDLGDIFEFHFTKYFHNGGGAPEFEFFDPTAGATAHIPLVGANLSAVLDYSNYSTATNAEVNLASTGGRETHTLTGTIESYNGPHYIYRIGIGNADTSIIRPGITAMRIHANNVSAFKTVKMDRFLNGAATKVFSDDPEDGSVPAVSYAEPVIVRKKR